MRTTIPSGIRVVRGPNWIWQNQDNGEGHVGTVCQVGRYGSTHSPENTVVVNWDSGQRTNYRVGYQDQYDLIIVDNAQVGIRHSNLVCDGCSKGGIAGIVFKCAQCSNYHLCVYCYGSDMHETEHTFIRYTTSTSLGVLVTPRKGMKKIQLRGIFVGAKVRRGPDWEWGQQDGGEGNTGRVLEIRGWDNESCRSVANVSWITGSTNVYRVGHKGNIDLKYTAPTSGGFYYKDHMPVLGQLEEEQPVMSIPIPSFCVGDHVKARLEVDALIKVQQGHGGWNPRMIDHLTKLGTVHRITEKGDIRVQYENCSNRWTFHPAALVKIITFRVGDLVTVICDVSKVKQLQKGHGEWIENMRHVLGKHCKVIKVYSDGDLRIQQLDDGFEWTFNPKCITLKRSSLTAAKDNSNSMTNLSHRRSNHIITPLSELSGTSVIDKLVREAAQGHLDFVKQYLDKKPFEIDVTSAGKSCIQVAAHQGHADLVQYLISKGANENIVDKEGDSALHYAAFGNQPETMRILLQSGADVNILNSSHCSALHICAHKKTTNCVRELLQFGADVNIQDSYGDTAMHDAIGKENFEVVELLCNTPNLDFTVKNNRGFNVLHHASLKGNIAATKRILQLSRQLTNVKKDDGFAALHLAALNGHAKIIESLIVEGQAEIDIRNNRQQTPFLLAVSQGHLACIEKLVTLGCNVRAKDEDGDNALHICVIKKSNLSKLGDPTGAPEIQTIYLDLSHLTKDRLMLTILCYLTKKGCKMEQNNRGVDIFEWITENHEKQLFSTYQCSTEKTKENIGLCQITQQEKLIKNYTTERANIDIYPSCTGKSNTNTSSSSNSVIISEMTQNVELKTNADILDPISTSKISIKNTLVKQHINKTTKQNSITSVNNNSGITEEPRLKNNSSKIYNDVYNEEGAACLRGTVCEPTQKIEKCIVCDEVLPLIKFEPCNHQNSCEECGVRMKKCLQCGAYIERRITENGHVLFNANQMSLPSADRIRYLENKIQEYEESHYCSICMERIRNVAFLCGHGACSRCADTLRTCHMCRKTIWKKINLY